MNQIEIINDGAEAAIEIIEKMSRVNLQKALDPFDDTDFLIIVSRIARALRKAVAGAEQSVLDRAARILDVDWNGISRSKQDEIFRAVAKELARLPISAMPVVERMFGQQIDKTIETSRSRLSERYGLKITPTLARTDSLIARHIKRSQSNFVRDQYGLRTESYSRLVRDVVANAAKLGLGSKDIVKELQTFSSLVGLGHSDNYWTTVVMSFVNSARNFAHLSSLREAGVTKFRFQAVLDEVTTEICRFMHGKVFLVENAINAFADAAGADDPEDVKKYQPWVREGRNGNTRYMYFNRGETREVIANINSTGMGSRSVGSYSRAISDADLEAHGIMVPPLHGRCRSTILAEL
ncbi:MAG: hypothetical protein A2Y38_13920 [Spirochaetes bacterium GWB1_59_5]|nr:MAG: hypothetical protein A2Y38_13920 [Spirochaetes bacterium GWB1_59_5]